MVALVAVLVCLAPLVGLNPSFSADEGAVLAQADHLIEGDGWLAPHPFPEADPDLAWYPLDRAARAGDRFAPYAKLPLYAVMVAGLYAIGGMGAVVGLSLAGTVAAAWGAAAITRRLRPELVVPVFWLIGAGSPLLFDGYLVMAHAFAAGCVAGAAVSVLGWYERRCPGLLVAAGAAVLVAVGVRQEALLLAAAGAIVAGWRWTRRRSVDDAVVAVTLAGAAAVAFVLNRIWVQAILGTASVSIPATGSAGGGLAGRVSGFTTTWFGFGDEELLFLALLLVTAAALAARSARFGRLTAAFSGAAAVLSFLAAVSVEHGTVTGLLVAFPVLAAGLASLRREDTAGLAGALLAISGLFAAAVILTQYERGGTGEWGGRYFAIGLVLVVPVALGALWRSLLGLPADTRRLAAGALAVCTVAVSITGVAALRGSHQRTAELTEGVAAVAATTTSGDGGPPVVVATERLIPRLSWRHLDEGRWLLVPRDDLGRALEQLRDLGIRQVTVATYLPAGEQPAAVDGWSVREAVQVVSAAPWYAVLYDRS